MPDPTILVRKAAALARLTGSQVVVSAIAALCVTGLSDAIVNSSTVIGSIVMGRPVAPAAAEHAIASSAPTLSSSGKIVDRLYPAADEAVEVRSGPRGLSFADGLNRSIGVALAPAGLSHDGDAPPRPVAVAVAVAVAAARAVAQPARPTTRRVAAVATDRHAAVAALPLHPAVAPAPRIDRAGLAARRGDQLASDERLDLLGIRLPPFVPSGSSIVRTVESWGNLAWGNLAWGNLAWGNSLGRATGL